MRHTKKILAIAMCCVLATGCGSADDIVRKQNVNNSKTVEDVLNAGIAQEESKKSEDNNEVLNNEVLNNDSNTTVSTSEDNKEINESTVIENSDSSEDKDTVEKEKDNNSEVDIDLTEMSATLVYSEVFSILSDPESYIGSSIKMRGYIAYYYDENTQAEYFSCVVQDATACCAQGIEFCAANVSKEQIFENIDSEIEVVGKLDTYLENGFTYLTLKDADVKFIGNEESGYEQ